MRGYKINKNNRFKIHNVHKETNLKQDTKRQRANLNHKLMNDLLI